MQTTLEELKSINRILDRICRVRETNHIMSIILDELIKATEASQGVINLTPKSDEADLVTVVRKSQAQSEELPYKVNSAVSGWVLKNKRILKVDDLDNDDRFSRLSSVDGRFKSILCCPMVSRGEVIGLTSLIRDQGKGPFRDDHGRLVGIVVTQSAQVLSNAILLEELAQKNELLEISQRKLKDENIRLQTEVGSTYAFENIVGKSEPMKKVLTLASKVSGNDSPALIAGATGTGKELIARAIHYQSERREMPFIVKNCGVKTETLLESELFGHVKGAFTGADRDKPGLFKEADGGTIFLDEIGEAPLTTQVAILRVLESGEIRPIGAGKTTYVNVRIISATNRDIGEEIKQGSFRQDLFYRLNTFTIDLPPLSERREDIPLLVHHFLKKIKVKLDSEDISITPAAMEVLTGYAWPGNVRQLENEIERAAVVSDTGGVIDVADLSPELQRALIDGSGFIDYRGKLRDVVSKVEQDIITKALVENNGNIQKTSRDLGLTRKGLKDKMARYGITPGDE
jgi:Nif-specific regulatory protein